MITESSVATDFFRDGVKTAWTEITNVLTQIPEEISAREAGELLRDAQPEIEARLVARLDQLVAEHDATR